MAHLCHAHACNRAVPPRMLFCRRHWFALPVPLQNAIWQEYRPGQEIDKNPSPRYMAVQRRAVAVIAFKPYDETAALIAAPYALDSERWRKLAVASGLGDPLEGIAP